MAWPSAGTRSAGGAAEGVLSEHRRCQQDRTERKRRQPQLGATRRRSRLESRCVDFELVGDLTDVETIAAGRGIRELPRLRRLYGKGYWRKMKGSARIRLRNGRIRRAEIHWYEAHGIGKKEFKRKRYLDEA